MSVFCNLLAKILDYLDIKSKNNGQGKCEFQVHHKEAITNVQIRPNSSHDPKIHRGIFKGFVNQAYKNCSEQHVKGEVEFLINVFVENGSDEGILKQLSREVQSKIQAPNELPSSRNNDERPTIVLPWIPGVSPKLRKAYRQVG